MEVVEQILRATTTLQQSAPKRFKPSSRIVLWVLGDRGRIYSLTETLKSLVYQALCFKFDSGNTSPIEISFQVTKFQNTYFEDDYLKMPGNLPEDFNLVCMFEFISPFLLAMPAFRGARALMCRF